VVRAAPQVLHGVDAAEDGHVRHPERRLHGVDALDRALVVPVHLSRSSFPVAAVLNMRDVAQIGYSVVVAIAVDVIAFMSLRARPGKARKYEPVHTESARHTVFAQADLKVSTAVKTWLQYVPDLEFMTRPWSETR
jgi:hypothetical protein